MSKKKSKKQEKELNHIELQRLFDEAVTETYLKVRGFHGLRPITPKITIVREALDKSNKSKNIRYKNKME